MIHNDTYIESLVRLTLDDACLNTLELYGGGYSGLNSYPSNSKGNEEFHQRASMNLRTENEPASTKRDHYRNLPEDHGTSHISVIDKWGNAVAMTTTINTYFGSKFISPSTGKTVYIAIL